MAIPDTASTELYSNVPLDIRDQPLIEVVFKQPVDIKAIDVQGGTTGRMSEFTIAYSTEDNAQLVPITDVGDIPKVIE